MTRPRDSQFGRLNQAEQAVRTGYAPMQQQALQVLANRIAGNSWFQGAATDVGRTISAASISVGAAHRCEPRYAGRMFSVQMAPGRSTMLDLFHSAAHVITADDVPLHGPQFAKNMLAMTQFFGTTAKRNTLRDAFKASRVKYIYKSEEAKAAARERAAVNGTPFTRPKVSREVQQDDVIAMMRELAGLDPLPEPEDPIERMLKAAKRNLQ